MVDLWYWYPNLLGPLRDDPRYESLIRKINESWGLNPDGSLPDEANLSAGPEGDRDV